MDQFSSQISFYNREKKGKNPALKMTARSSHARQNGIFGFGKLFAMLAVFIFAAHFAAAQNPSPPKAGSDEFNSERFGAQWQWQANFQGGWAFMFPARGVLRMNSVQTPEKFKNLRDVPNLLLQKFPAEEFTATAKMTLAPRFEGEKFGLIVMGLDYSYAGVTHKGGKLFVAQAVAKDAEKGFAETENQPYQLGEKTFYLRVKVEKGGLCQFSFSPDGAKFTNLGTPFSVKSGARIGLFFTRPGKFNDAGTADVDWFRVE